MGDSVVLISTRSEAIQQALKKGDCPYLLVCEALITKNFFDHICNSTSYPNCHHFANRVGELNAPMVWLQKIAVQEGKQITSKGEEKTAQAGVES